MTAAQKVKLGDVAEFIRGVTFKPTDVIDRAAPGAVVCMRTSNVQATLDQEDVFALPPHFVGREEQYLREGDMLVSSANSWNLVGKACWVPSLGYRATAGGFISILRARSGKIDERYLYRWFTEPKTQALVRNCGRQTTNISNLNIPRCLALELPLPTLAEQKRIAAVLDKADDLRAKRRHALATLDTLIQSVFLDMFGDPVTNPKGWPTPPMSELVAVKPIFGSMIPPGESGEWLSLRVGNIQDWKLDLSDSKYIDLEPEDVDRHGVLDADLLMARAIASQDHLGKSIIAYPNGRRWAFDSHLMRVRFDRSKAEPEYVRHCLTTDGGRNLFLKVTHRSAVQFNVNTTKFAKLRLPIPPIADQREFTKRIEAIDQNRRQQVEAASCADALFAALQSAAFAGALFTDWRGGDLARGVSERSGSPRKVATP